MAEGQEHQRRARLHLPAAHPGVPQPDLDVARPPHGHEGRLQEGAHITGTQDAVG